MTEHRANRPAQHGAPRPGRPAFLGRAALFVVLVLLFPALVSLLPPARRAAPLAQREWPETLPHTDLHGDPLPAGAVARLGTVRFRHAARIQSVAVSPDGKVLASGGWDHHVCLWDAATGKRLHQIHVGPQCVYALAFSGDGRTLAALSGHLPGNYKTMRISLLDVATAKPLSGLEVAAEMTSAIAFAPDGRELICATPEGSAVIVRAAATGETLRRLEGHRGKVVAVAFIGDGRTLASAAADKTVRRWDTVTGRQLQEVTPRDAQLYEDRRPALAFSPDGRRLALGDYYRLHVYDAATGKQLWESSEDRGVSCSPVFSPDGRTVAAGCMNDAVCLWDAASGKELRPRSGHQLRITTLAASPDGRAVASFGEDTALFLWDVASAKERFHYPHVSRTNRCLTFTPDGKATAWTGWRWKSDVCLWDTSTGKELRRFAVPPTRNVRQVAFAADGATIAAATEDGVIRVWDTANARELGRFEGGSHPVFLSFTPDGRKLASGDNEGLVCWWDVASGRELHRFPVPVRRLLSAALSPDGRLLAWDGASGGGGSTGGVVHLMDAETGAEVGHLVPERDMFELSFRRHREGLALAFSADGRVLACAEPGSYDKPRIWVFELATKGLRCTLEGHLQPARALAFSGDSRLLVSGGWDCTILVWDLTGRGSAAPEPLSAERLEGLWADLAERDAGQAYRAMQALAAASARSVPLLRARLRPVEAADPEQVGRLLAALSEKRFETRRRAEAELAKLRDAAEPALRRFLESDRPLEAVRRVEGLLKRLEGEWREPASERLRFLRAVEVLEWIASAGVLEARQALESFAGGATGARATEEARAALRRLRKQA